MNNDLKKKYGKVAVIMGGRSSEREISLVSGKAVLETLQRLGVDAHAFDPYLEPFAKLEQGNYTRAILMTHGRYGEDGTLQGVLEYLKIPYTGSGVLASALAFDKYKTKQIWRNYAIPMAKEQYIKKNEFNAAKFILELHLPVIIKPSREGSTIGIQKVFSPEALIPAIENAFKYDSAVLIEELIIGDEFTVTVFNNEAYPLVKIVAPDANYDYNNKYFNDSTQYICPFELGPLMKDIEKYAILGYNAVGARGVTRLDFMLDKNNKLYFLEINTIPGMTGHSLVPMAFKAKGYSFEQLCLKILDDAHLG
jgi:D-alanine-D-alanine ligase